MAQKYIVIPDPFDEGRWVVARVNAQGWATAVESHPCQATAEKEAAKLNRQSTGPKGQLQLGFTS